MDGELDRFVAWIAARSPAGVDPALYRRCIEWIVRCSGRIGFDDHDVADAIARAAMDPSAASRVDAIRAAGETWMRWRSEQTPNAFVALAEDAAVVVLGPQALPDRTWVERARAAAAARVEIRAATLVDMAIGREPPRAVLWLELVDAAPEPHRVIAAVAAALPHQVVEVRGADSGPLNDLCRRVGAVIFELPTTACTPPIQAHEDTEGLLAKRYTLHLMAEIDGSIAVAECLRAVERRIREWIAQRAGRARAVSLGFRAPRRLHEVIVRDIEAALSQHWPELLTDGGNQLMLKLAMFDERGELVVI